jgi:flagellar hook-length control protein FliK
MIFNPLFLSENNGSQIMAPKQTKMSNNKYLFSDIVKVVMTPVGESTEMTKTNDGIIGNNIGLSLDNAQKPVQLKLKFLSDLDNEKAKLGLAEILPIEIAQLLIKDETENSEEKAVSYISKEPLTGELQNFVNNLIGPELIANHLNNESGLLLSLEDSKSAVNLELVQVSGKQSINENIVVQTLVVPEKSKLLSLMGDVQAKNGLFRIDNSQIQNLTNIGQPVQNSLETNGDTKPTLSVYSFNYGGDKFESLTKSIKLNNDIKPGLSLVSKLQVAAGLNEGINKVPLEKISFIPSELKTSQQGISNPSLNNKSTANLITESLKLVSNESENTPKDFSVSKITIVKKTNEIVAPEKVTVNNKLFGSRLDPELKRIDFGSPNALNSKSSSNTNDLNVTAKLSDQKNNILKNILPSSEKGEKVSQNRSVNETLKTESSKPAVANNLDEIKQKNINAIKSIIDNSNKAAAKTENNNVNVKTIIGQKSDTNIEVPKNITPNDSLKEIQKVAVNQNQNNLNEKSKIDSKSVPVNNEKEFKTNSKQADNFETKISLGESNSTKPSAKVEGSNANMNSKVSEEILRTIEGKVGVEKISGENDLKQERPVLQRTEKENLESVKSETNRISNANIKESNIETKIEPKTLEVPKSETLEQSRNGVKNNVVDVNEVLLKTKEIGIKENKVTDEKQIPIQNIELKNDEPLANKKISVKVKGEVKSVSEKLDVQAKNNQDTSQKENSTSSNTNKENSSYNEFKNSPFPNSHFNMNVSTENSFQTILNENGVGVSSDIQSKHGIESDLKSKTIKSVEVLKEVVKFISKQEKGSLSFDIKPEQLGKMKITLDSADHVLRAKIEVDTEQARQLIERNLDKLHQELADNGIELNSLNISLSNPKQKKEDGETMNNNNNNQTQNLGQVGETEEKEQKKTLGYNTYEYIA